jgi:hypothetical protein
MIIDLIVSFKIKDKKYCFSEIIYIFGALKPNYYEEINTFFSVIIDNN